MPGVPSIYYGSEWGIEGKRQAWSDRPLRPHLDLRAMAETAPHPGLVTFISRLSEIRHNSTALRRGDYRPIFVNHEQFAFARQTTQEYVIVLVNAADHPYPCKLVIPQGYGDRLIDLLNSGETFPVDAHGKARIEPVRPCWARILLAR
jgi:glycosidase